MKVLIFALALLTVVKVDAPDQTEREASEIPLIMEKISKLKRIEKSKLFYIAKSIDSASKEYGIDSSIMTSIIMVESSFNQKAISKTGDYGIVQINYKTWQKEFSRLKQEGLDYQRLKTDSDYGIHQMARILSLLKARHGDKDPLWFARYHSGTSSLKLGYSKKVERNIAMF